MNIKDFNSLYSNILNKISLEKKQIIIMGDFNIDLIKIEENKDIEDFLHYNLQSHNPTL